MSSPIPQPVIPKSGGYSTESSTFTSITDLYRFFSPKKIRVSKNSPPGTTDVNELEWCIDKSTLKVWIKVDGTLRYFQLT